jgi:hypothetical protein
MIAPDEKDTNKIVSKHVIAVTTNLEESAKFGIS